MPISEKGCGRTQNVELEPARRRYLRIVKKLAYHLVSPLVINAFTKLFVFACVVAPEPTRSAFRRSSDSLNKGGHLLNTTIVALGSTSLAITLLVVALVREVRLRRALQRLLAKLLAHWRKHHADDRTSP